MKYLLNWQRLINGTFIQWNIPLMVTGKCYGTNLGCHIIPPLDGISSRNSGLGKEVGMNDRVEAGGYSLFWLSSHSPVNLWSVFVISTNLHLRDADSASVASGFRLVYLRG